MANITEIKDKSGNTVYKITVFLGRNSDNKQIKKSKTFRPEPSMKKREIKKALESFASDFEAKCKSGSIVAERQTLQDYAAHWLSDFAEKELENTTVTRYKHGLNNTILPRIGYMKLADIKASTVQEFLNSMREKGYKRGGTWIPYSEESVRTCKIILSSVLSAAVADGLIATNPCSIRQRQHKKVQRKEVRCFSVEQAAKFLEVIEKPIPIIVPEHLAKRHGKETLIPEFQQGFLEVSLKFRALYTLTIFSGLRRGELLGLQWKDVDFKEGSINVVRTVQYTPSDGLFIKAPKSSAGFRTIFLPEAVMIKLHELKPGITKKGYCLVVLRKNGESKYFSVHRLVAKAFIPNPENFDQVNHINEIKTDNRAENLEWCDGKYNMNYGSRRSKQIQKVSKPVLCVETNTVYKSTVHASKELSISQGNISRCCLGKAKTCGGFHWKYI